MAAISAIASMLKSGDHVIVSDNVYGGTFRLFDKVLTRYQLSFSYVDTGDLEATERAFTPSTRMLFVETPSNPVMRITDLAKAAELAHGRGARLVVDNTFASPVLQQPIAFGADLVTHARQVLNGHSDRGRRGDRGQGRGRCQFVQNAAGASSAVRFVAGPARHQDAKSDGPALRHRRALAVIRGARRFAGLLSGSLTRSALAARQMKDFGGMISFDLGPRDAAARLLKNVRLLSLAESLGGVESLISHPATMTHASVPVEHRNALGITDGLVRISAGLEDLEDLKEDLTQALQTV